VSQAHLIPEGVVKMKALILLTLVLLGPILLLLLIPEKWFSRKESVNRNGGGRDHPTPKTEKPPPALPPVFDPEHLKKLDAFANLMENMQAHTKTPISDASMLQYPKAESEEAIASYVAYMAVLQNEHPMQYLREGGEEAKNNVYALLMYLLDFADIKPEHRRLVDSINLGREKDPTRFMDMHLEYGYTGNKSVQERVEEAYARHRVKAIMRYSGSS